MILHVAARCSNSEYFGAIKLNKIIWKADFDSFAARAIPVTGREYRRQRLGPVLREMLPVQRDMELSGLIYIQKRDFGDGFIENRTVALEAADLSTFFNKEDLRFVERSLEHYWDMTGMESSDESHGVAWRTRKNGDSMPYELAYLSDEPLDEGHKQRVAELIRERGWASA